MGKRQKRKRKKAEAMNVMHSEIELIFYEKITNDEYHQ